MAIGRPQIMCFCRTRLQLQCVPINVKNWGLPGVGLEGEGLGGPEGGRGWVGLKGGGAGWA